MSAIPNPVSISESCNAAFLRFLPAVETHAKIQFRHLPPVDREDAISESVAAAFVNFKSAYQRGRADKLTPSTVAKYAILHVRTGRHVGGSDENTSDVLSHRAQMKRGFVVHNLPSNALHRYDCMRDPTSPVWKALLLEDRRTSVADQATFRLDWSAFLARQTDRTRTAVASLAAGYKRCEVADQLGVTPPAMTQRMQRVWRDWNVFQGEGGAQTDGQASAAPEQPRSSREGTPTASVATPVRDPSGDHPNRLSVNRSGDVRLRAR